MKTLTKKELIGIMRYDAQKFEDMAEAIDHGEDIDALVESKTMYEFAQSICAKYADLVSRLRLERKPKLKQPKIDMKVLVIGDTHFPAVHPGYLDFCKDLCATYKCDKIVHIGDVVDWHAISNHEKQPEAPDPLSEYEAAKGHVAKWKKAFPLMTVCEGNHDARIARQAATVNIPQRFLRGYNELYDVNWNWVPETKIDGVYYFHGTGVSGQYPAMTTMAKMMMSTAMGHVHSAGGIWWRANPERRIFGMNTGCGVDDRHVAFRYGEHLKTRSILSAGVVIDGTPFHVIMRCGHGEKYHKSRF